MEFMFGLREVAWFDDIPEQLIYASLLSVLMTLKYGTSKFTSRGFGGLAMTYAVGLQDIKGAVRISGLAKFGERFCIEKSDPKTWIMTWFMLHHWRNPMTEVLKPLSRAYEVGMANGETTWAFLSISCYCGACFLHCGLNLTRLEKAALSHLQEMEEYNQNTVANTHRVLNK